MEEDGYATVLLCNASMLSATNVPAPFAHLSDGALDLVIVKKAG